MFFLNSINMQNFFFYVSFELAKKGIKMATDRGNVC